MIRRQVVIPTGPDQLWEALTRPEFVRGWFGGEFDWNLTEGSALRFRGDDGGTREGRIDAVRPGRHLRFVWWPVPTSAETEAVGTHRNAEAGDDDTHSATEVSYLLEPLDDGVLLTVQERRIEAPAGIAEARARGTGAGSGRGEPGWTAWDTRLAGAWAGVVGASRVRA